MASSSNRPARLRFDSVERRTDDNNGRYHIEVRLTYDEKTYRGSCQGSINENDELELAASAALRAVEEFVQHRFECRLLDFDRVKAVGNDLIVLLVSVRLDDRDLQIFGSCKANDNLLDASARAALDATNRYVELVVATN